MSFKAKQTRPTPIVKAACEECRAKKTKCTGQRPVCARCSEKDRICIYDAEPDEYRTAALRRKCKVFERRALDGERLLSAMRNFSESEAVGLLRRLRAGEGVESIIASITTDAGVSIQHERETSPSVAGSCSSASSTALPLPPIGHFTQLEHFTREQSSLEARLQNGQDRDGDRTDQRLSISYLVAGGPSRVQQEPEHSVFSPHHPFVPDGASISRMASYPPVTAAAIEISRRASAPTPSVVAGMQALDPQRRPPAPTGQTLSTFDPEVTNARSAAHDWDQYYTNVSCLLRDVSKAARDGKS